MSDLINDEQSDRDIPFLLPPSDDGVFKALMTHPDAATVLPDLLSEFLGINVTSVELRNVELPISDALEKQERFDANCDFEDAEGKGQADVEMQAAAIAGDSFKNDFKLIKSRGTLYLCDLHSSQVGRGIRYDNLRRSYSVFFCGFKMFAGDKPVRHFKLRDEDGLDLTNAINEIFVELPKFDAALAKPIGEMTGREMWGLYFSCADKPERSEVVTEIVSRREAIKVADTILRNISTDPDMRAKYRSRMKFQTDLNTTIGIREDQVRNDIARKLISAGVSFDIITGTTGLTNDEIKRLRDGE
jgi:predicted transposase/invertase (TIGR01784 family)